jgi:two-component system, NarL family, sensor histidine kinase UhpB
MGLRLRLNLLLSLIFFATMGVGTAILLNVLRHGVSEELSASVEQTAKLITVAVNHLPPALDDLKLQRVINDIATIGSTRHLRMSTNVDRDSPFENVALEAPRWFFKLLVSEPLGLVRIVHLSDKRRQVVIRADATAEVNEAWREAYPLFMMIALFGLLANGLIYILLGRSLRALQNVGDALQGLGVGNFAFDVPRVGISDIDRIGERVKELANDLQQSRAEAQSLTRRSLTIQEQERRDLAQALHDELGQSISAIRALGVSIQQNGDGGDGLNSSVKSIIEVSGTMYERVRDMMSLLRPSILDELGLRLALENMIDDWNSHYEDTFCRLEVSAILPDVEENIAINIFRIVQEALTNVARHARASDVIVEIAEQNIDEKPCLTLRIEDDGIGFNPRTVNKGLGIFGIEDRVAAMHGMLTLDSGASGTRYEIVVPLPQVAVQVSDVEKG